MTSMKNLLTNKLNDLFWTDFLFQGNFPEARPLLAHYTTVSAFESIIRNEEIWFSSPLNMNDYEEMRFVVFESMRIFRNSVDIRDACGNSARYSILTDAMERQFNLLNYDHASGIYVFCMTEHESGLDDGILSMWRGYGANGNGIALVIDTAKLVSVDHFPIMLSKVSYLSKTQRLGWINQKLVECTKILSSGEVSDNDLSLVAEMLFDRIKLFSLVTKHPGFSEEKEWRVIYMKDRDNNHLLSEMIDYVINGRGPELKFKYKFKPVAMLDEKNQEDFSLENLVQKLIVGPCISGALTKKAVERMLQKIGKPNLIDKLVASTIPYRSS